MHGFVILKYLGLLEQLAPSLIIAEAQLSAGQPVAAPPIRTYIGGKHVEIAITVTELP